MTHAPAAGPLVNSNIITTPRDGLRDGRSTYPVGADAVPFYFAAPATGEQLPVILVVQEIFGLHDYIADTCRRFAQRGYLAVAPELYFRQGDASRYTDMAQLMGELVSKVPDARVLGDLDGALQWAGSHGGDLGRAAITGFCWGGRMTWLYCAHNPNIRTGVAWYGRLVGARTDLAPRHPVDIAAQLKAPVLGLYGAQDTGIPLDTVEQMQAALAAAGSGGNAAAAASTIHVYPDAPHAFHADYRPSYRQAEAEDGFRRALDWLQKQGVA